MIAAGPDQRLGRSSTKPEGVADGLSTRSSYAAIMPTMTPSPVPVPPPGVAVAAAAQENWRVLGEVSQIVDWPIIASALGIEPGEVIKTAIVLPQLGRIECILDDQADMRHAEEQLRELLVRGWSVNALLPMHSLGAAHQALRGLRIHLQGWWKPDDERLRFTSLETP
jgi:hypothetical protein